jgi:hypothetical protein
LTLAVNRFILSRVSDNFRSTVFSIRLRILKFDWCLRDCERARANAMKRVASPAKKRIFPRRSVWRLVLIGGMFCVILAALFAWRAPASTSAASQRSLSCFSLSSSPTQGPVGAIVAVNCTHSNQPSGTRIQLGYTTDFIACNAASDSQVSTVQKDGSFSGWLRWPSSTGTGTFAVCASIPGSDNPIISNDTYHVLSANAPQASVTPAIPDAGQQATVTGANFYPAGTNVNLIWQPTNGGASVSLGTATSDNNGAFSQTFTVPRSANTGTYTLTVATGGAQPPTMSAATTFKVNGITLVAVPTPSVQPDPTALASPTATARSTQTASTLTTDSTAHTGGTSSGLLLPLGLVGLLLIVVALVLGVFVVRWRRRLALAAAAAASAPVNLPFTPGPVAVSQANTLPPPMSPGRGRTPPGVPRAGGGMGQAPVPFDPGLAEAMRQAQVSLFATPRPPVGEEVFS